MDLTIDTTCRGSIRDPHLVLTDLKERISRSEVVIPIQADLRLTKTAPSYTHAYIFRDLELERATRRWIEGRTSAKALMDRYRERDPGLPSTDWPCHYPVRILAGVGPVCSGSNIFMFFPGALGLTARDESDYLGFEFIDVWANIFDRVVFPCMRELFDIESQLAVAAILKPVFDQTCYLASLFHEIGHRVAPWRISPSPDPELTVTGFPMEVIGELWTDSLLVVMLEEFPEIAHFVTQQRLFWFGRRGFKDNPESSKINEDNDAWIAAYLWEMLKANGAIEPRQGQLHLHTIHLADAYRAILDDLESLAAELPGLELCARNAAAERWLASRITRTPDGRFLLPVDLVRTYFRCREIPEVPDFTPMLKVDRPTHSLLFEKD